MKTIYLFLFLFGLTGWFVNRDHQLNIFKNYEEGLEIAQQNNQPIFLLFTGLECKNNESIQAILQKDSLLQDLLKAEFTNIWLFVDDRTLLPEKEIKLLDGKAIEISTFGQKGGFLEMEKFGRNVQPLVAILDENGNPVQEPKAFHELQGDLYDHVSAGLKSYRKK